MRVNLSIFTLVSTVFVTYLCQDTATTEETIITDSTTNDAAATTDTSTSEKEYPLDVTSLHCDESKLKDFKTGDHVYVCIHILPRELRMAFNVTVDNYEVLSISGGFIFSDKDTTNAEQSYVFQFGNVSTPYPSLYYSKAKKEIAPLFNVVIKLDKGNITDVVWDNDCWDCSFTGGCQTYDNIISFRNKSEVYSENVSTYLIYYLPLLLYFQTNIELRTATM